MSAGRGSECAALLWPVLEAKADGSRVSYTISELCRAVGRSRRTVQYGLRQLREAGLVGFADQRPNGVWIRPIYVGRENPFVEDPL